MEDIFRKRMPRIGWVALSKWPDGTITLRIRGYIVFEESPKRPKPNLKVV